MKKQEIPNKIYLVWQPIDEDGNGGYFNQYDSLEGCFDDEQYGVDDDGEGIAYVEIYEANPKLLGRYTKKTSAVKVRTPKKAKG